MKEIVLFEQALQNALERVRRSAEISKEFTLVRDYRGRIRLLLAGSEREFAGKNKEIEELSTNLSKELGNYGFKPDQMILYSKDLAVGDSELKERITLHSEVTRGVTVYLLDRQITGQDWLKETFTRETKNPRVTVFGIKGGVGRSTALVIWAWYLAKQGRKILVFDMDLESPGVSSTLLPPKSMSDFGIVDWFVEDGVGQGEEISNEMVVTSPLSAGLAGEIRVVPSFGSKTQDYLSKLSRCYSELPDDSGSSWGHRLRRLVQNLENRETPDLTILDSRAGVHDIAALAVTRLDAFSFLFGVDSAQTWNAYSFLFRHWKRHSGLKKLREKLQVVASMVPETGRDNHLRRFREHSWDLFSEFLYDEASAEEKDAFNFDLSDEDGPHFPLPVFWHRALQEFDPAVSDTALEEKTAEEALGIFMKRANQLVFALTEEE